MAKMEELNDEIDRREYRRRRRVRNQIISYVVLGVFLVSLVFGGVLGVNKLIAGMKDRKQAEELQKQLEELSQAEQEPQVVEAPEESTENYEEVDYLDEIVNASIAEMPLEDKVAGLFIITPEALTDTDVVIKAGDTTKEKLGQHAVGGLVYF